MPRQRKRQIALVVVFSVAIVFAYLTFGERVTRASLSHSVAGQVGPSFFGSCRRPPSGGRWVCQIMSTDGSSSGISYTVTDTGRCWHGSQTADGGLTGLPPAISGCVGLLDQIRTDDFIGSGTKYRRPGFY